MTLADLSKPQWDAALEAARALKGCNPHSESDRAHWRKARDRLVSLLPDGADDRSIVTQAVHWDSLNDFALAFGGIPEAQIEAVAR